MLCPEKCSLFDQIIIYDETMENTLIVLLVFRIVSNGKNTILAILEIERKPQKPHKRIFNFPLKLKVL